MKRFLFCWLTVLFVPGLGTVQATQIRVQPVAGSLARAVAQAVPGDTIRMSAGVYFCSDLLIDKTLCILGEGDALLDGRSASGILRIKAHGVRLEGLVLRNTGNSSVNDIAAIRAEGCKGLKIINNTLQDAFFGIYLAACSDALIYGNKLSASNDAVHSGNGIHLWKCTRIRILGNQVSGHRDGIYFEFATHSEVKANRCEMNHRYGLHFMFSDDDTYSYNTFRRNGCGVAVMYTRRIHMYSNTFDANWGATAYGLLLKDINDSRIGYNRFSANTSGVYMEGSNRVLFERNLFESNGLAVRLLANCEQNRFNHNNFIGNTFDFTTNGSGGSNELRCNYWDKYSGYDLDGDRMGDPPYRPVSLFSRIIERLPAAVFLLRSFVAGLLDQAERALPSLSFSGISDEEPRLEPNIL